MQLVYQSDQFVVVAFDVVPEQGGDRPPAPRRGGYEIVDKLARREIFIEGAVAEQFQIGVRSLVEDRGGADAEALDEFIGRYTQLAQQPVVMH